MRRQFNAKCSSDGSHEHKLLIHTFIYSIKHSDVELRAILLSSFAKINSMKE